MLALLSQHLLDERWVGHVNRQDGTEAGLPHGPVPLHAFHLARGGKTPRLTLQNNLQSAVDRVVALVNVGDNVDSDNKVDASNSNTQGPKFKQSFILYNR